MATELNISTDDWIGMVDKARKKKSGDTSSPSTKRVNVGDFDYDPVTKGPSAWAQAMRAAGLDPEKNRGHLDADGDGVDDRIQRKRGETVDTSVMDQVETTNWIRGELGQEPVEAEDLGLENRRHTAPDPEGGTPSNDPPDQSSPDPRTSAPGTRMDATGNNPGRGEVGGYTPPSQGAMTAVRNASQGRSGSGGSLLTNPLVLGGAGLGAAALIYFFVL